jgi:hypothetical protein
MKATVFAFSAQARNVSVLRKVYTNSGTDTWILEAVSGDKTAEAKANHSPCLVPEHE